MNFSEFDNLDIIKYNFALSNFSSMKTGGNAKYAFFPNNKDELRTVVVFLKENNIRFCVIGFASNILFPDDGYDGAVVFTVNMNNVCENIEDEILERCKAVSSCEHFVYAEAGASLTSFAYKMLKCGFAGLEFAYGIPASVGGAIYMNAGAYGGELSDTLVFAEYLDEKGEFQFLYNDKSKNTFSYRHSPFTDDKTRIIVGGIFALPTAKGEESMAVALQNMASRKSKQPLEFPSCGSAFKRPVGYYAGALIEGAGLKGCRIGGACVSEKHAGFIINAGGASTNDVLALIKHVQSVVMEKYGVMLEPEIRIAE